MSLSTQILRAAVTTARGADPAEMVGLEGGLSGAMGKARKEANEAGEKALVKVLVGVCQEYDQARIRLEATEAEARVMLLDAEAERKALDSAYKISAANPLPLFVALDLVDVDTDYTPETGVTRLEWEKLCRIEAPASPAV